MTYHSPIEPLSAGDTVERVGLGGLVHASPMALFYAARRGGLVAEFAPAGCAERGPEGLLVAAGGVSAFTLKDAAKAFIDAEEAAGSAFSNQVPIETNGTVYLRGTLPDGQFLSSQLKTASGWSSDERREVLLTVADPLQAAHANGVFHGALSTHHIFLPKDGSAAQVIGFGDAPAALVLGITLAPTNGFQGERADVYALSEIAYQLLTGEAPTSYAQREAAQTEGQQDPLVSPSEYVSQNEHRSLIQAITKGLSLDDAAASLEDWAFTVGGRTRVTPDAPSAETESPKAAPPPPVRPQRAAPDVPHRPMRPARGKKEQPERQGTPLSTVALFLLGLAVLTGGALYASQSGLFEPKDDPNAPTEETEQAEQQPAGPGPADERAWVNARTIDTVESYTAYLKSFPEGYYIEDAQERLNALDDAAWQGALALNTLEAYRAYIEEFPLGLHVPEAQQLVDRLEAGIRAIAAADEAAFKEARRLDTVAAYDGYLGAYPDGAFVEEATQRRETVLETSRDDQAFAAAERLGTRKAYQSYVDRFPKGQYVSNALTMLDKLTARAGDVLQDCKRCPSVVILPKGSFDMGAADGDRFAKPSEKPKRSVTFAQPFAMGQTEVTVGQWKDCTAAGACKSDPRNGSDPSAPVVFVGWQGARDYAAWLSRTTGKDYRLPTEAEWEYAARAGDTGVYPAGRESSVCKLGNIAGNETNVPWRSKTCEDGVANGVEPVQR
ncbi:MAG: SUMF1/EgtB/PvdO family nonheme iron enzyme, partial [Pseudomonadota bacterium]